MHSVLLTILLDGFFVTAAAVAAVHLLTHAGAIRFAGAVLSVRLLVAGLVLWSSYYLADLLLLILGPLFLEEARLHAWSDVFQHNVRGAMDAVAVFLLLVGFVTLLDRLGRLLTRMQGSAEALEHELTSRETLEAELKSEAEIERAYRQSKSEFLLGLSHQLRTPLNGILGLASLLSNTELDREQRKLLLTLEQSAQSMLGRVSDVLDLSLLENHRVELRSNAFRPCDLARSAAALFEPMAQDKAIALSVSCSPASERTVIGDPARIKQILTHLLSNALKFTPAGTIRLDADLQPLDSEHCRLVFTVADTGIGMSPEILEEVAAARTLRTGADAGVGLSICWRLAGLMDGQLHFDSQPDRGTKVRAELVVQNEPVEADEIV
jgi:signal transduction histidine kinase